MASVSQNSTATAGKRAAIYCRVSTRSQDDEGSSLDTQAKRCIAYADRNGHTVIAEPFREVHTAFEYRERPMLTQLREMARRREIDVIVCHSVDRLSRNQTHTAILFDEMERLGVALEFATEVFEDSAVGKFILSAKSFAAEFEREKIRERTLRGRGERLKAGKQIGGPALYGYRWVNNEHGKQDHYEIDPEEAAVVRRIYEMMIAGKSLRQVGVTLSAEGIPSPRGKDHWHVQTVSKIIRFGTYCGQGYALTTRSVKVNGKKVNRPRPEEDWVPISSPAIVSPETWAAVQDLARKSKERHQGRNLNPSGFLLRGGFIHCGHCGYALRVNNHLKDNGQRIHSTYECQSATKYVGICTWPSITAHIIDGAVWAFCTSILSDPNVIERELERKRNEPAPAAADLAAIDDSIKRVESQQANYARALATIDQGAMAPVVAQLNALAKQRLALDKERQALVSQQAVHSAITSQLEQLSLWRNRVVGKLETATYDQKRQVIEALGIQVKLYRQGSPERYVITAAIDLAGFQSPESTVHDRKNYANAAS